MEQQEQQEEEQEEHLNLEGEVAVVAVLPLLQEVVEEGVAVP